jgi:predicted DNA-binding transcriptional regulator AlpA
MRAKIKPASGGRLLSKREVCAALGDISDDTLDRLVKSERFPRPLRVGRSPKWTDGDVAAFIAARDAERRERD